MRVSTLLCSSILAFKYMAHTVLNANTCKRYVKWSFSSRMSRLEKKMVVMDNTNECDNKEKS